MRRAGRSFTEADGVDEAFTMKAFLDGTARKRNWFSFPEFFGKVSRHPKVNIRVETGRSVATTEHSFNGCAPT